ncbi:MAG: hypothetical protein JNK53_08950, partial [Phycisphaerae bacterium]|nr:hypothetical protein [Phycisphaerae bacterium]
MLELALLSTVLCQSPSPSDAAPAKMTPIAEGAGKKLRYYSPQRATMSTDKPPSLTKAPEGLKAAMYGTLPIGAGYLFILDEP